MIEIEETSLPEVKIIKPKKFGDERGFFSETWNSNSLKEVGITADFIQDNHAFSRDVGTVRGLHYQMSPKAQGKLVRVIKGRVLDVAVDIRRGSPNFGKHVGVELSADNWFQLWVPPGFAHGYCTLTPDVEFLYKVDNDYSPENEQGIIWNDPALDINWGVDPQNVLTSGKDLILPTLAQQDNLFEYGEF